MVEEGEFKKRIRELIELKTSDELSLALIQNPRLTSSQAKAFENKTNIRKSYLDRIIDEAKNDIFEPIEDMMAYVLDPKNKNDLTIGVRQRKLVYALIKWFGK